MLLISLFTASCCLQAGAWGYGPRDSDAAMDIVVELQGATNKIEVLDEIFSEFSEADGFEDSVRGACDYLVKDISHDGVRIDQFLSQCLNLLNRMLFSKEYIDAWNQPEEITRSLTAQINEVAKRQREAASNPQNDINQSIFWFGMIASLIGYIWLVVLAFQKHIGWGFASIVFSILVIYIAFNDWRRAWIPFVLCFGGNVLCIAAALSGPI